MTATLSPHLRVETPSAASIARDYDAIDGGFEGAGDLRALLAAIEAWDALRRRLHTWNSLALLRFAQDTREEGARRERETADALRPQIQSRDVAIKRRLLDHPLRHSLEERFGAQAFRLWSADQKTYAPEIEADLVRESELEAQYSSLIGAATVQFEGQQLTLAAIRGLCNAQDRETRHRAERARWSIYETRAESLDQLYDALVTLRHEIARKLGYENFIELAYARMHRVDYDAAAVERWRESVVRDVVPLAARVIEQSAKRRGYERAMFWDEAALIDADTRPQLDAAGMLEALPAVLGDVDARIGKFGTFMRDNDFLDVLAREGKGPGGFCTALPTEKHPFIFASFNGTKDDVRVLIHEMGHAFQMRSSGDLPLEDYLVPTFESAEIHSMSLEFLAWPAMERYFGSRAEAFRSEHLAHALLFLPYGCAVDHFQHLVYARPEATPQERRAMWLAMERRYLPWRTYGDLAHPAAGGFWQQQLHLYRAPFYYIDYTLAQCCALQFWAQSERDRPGTVERYVQLCARGGSRSFTELAASAGLASPFDGKALREVVANAERRLAAGGLLA